MGRGLHSLLLDPVDAYDRVAPVFSRLSSERRAYLETVERIVIAGIRDGSRSMLDVGAGDGARALRIARAARVPELTLLEPSAVMRSRCPCEARIWTMRAEELARAEGQFDTITCLWNVLGHIFPASARVEVLRQFARLIAPDGAVFADVNHRYNARHYGVLPTVARILHDCLLPGDSNGDVTVHWTVSEGRCVTTGHVFTHGEFLALCRAAGLRIERRYVIDYASGRIRRWGWQGHLLYLLRR